MNKYVFLMLALVLSGCRSEAEKQAEAAKYQECVNRGIDYYKAIGSYPRLQSQDISADDMVKESCNNAPDTAFKIGAY